jgi:hypothetical protein
LPEANLSNSVKINYKHKTSKYMKKFFTLLLLVLLTASFGYASAKHYDFLEDSVAYNVIDSTAKTVEVTYNIRPIVVTAPRTDLQPGMNKFDKSTGENIGSASQIMKVAAPQYEDQPYDSITSITIPSTVTHNGITYSVVRIGEKAFWGNSTIKTLTLPTSIKVISSYAFSNNDIYHYGGHGEPTALESIIMPEGGLDSIAPDAFNCSASLKNLVLPNCLRKIGNGAFNGCIKLEKVTIGSDAREFNGSAFSDCPSLKEFVVNNNPAYTTVDGVLYNADKTLLVSYPNARASSYDIPEGVNTVGLSAFRGSTVTDVKFPSTLVTVGRNAFNSSYLVKAELNEGVKTIGLGAFFDADSLCEITVPSTVTSIGEYAFATEYTNKNLKSFKCMIAEPLSINGNVFTIVNIPNCILYVPKGTVDAYKAAPVWKEFKILETLDGVNVVNAVKTVAGVKYVNAAGLQSSKPFEGINVVVTTYTDGTTSVAKQIKH